MELKNSDVASEASEIIKILEKKNFKSAEIMTITLAASKIIEAWIGQVSMLKGMAAVHEKILGNIE